MTEPRTGPVLVIVIGAQRKRKDTHPLAERYGVARKILVPLRGRPLITHVLDTLSTHRGVKRIAVSVEDSVVDALHTALAGRYRHANIDFVPAADNIEGSVIAAARGHCGPIIITTADNALLTHDSIDAVASALRRVDVAVAMSPREAVLAAHPDGQRHFYQFRDGEFSNCNLYGMASKDALRAAEAFRSGGQFASKAGRMIEAFGLINLIFSACGCSALAPPSGEFREGSS